MTKSQFILDTAQKLFLELPWWRKNRCFKWFRSNNWDVTHEWTNCIEKAKFLANVYEIEHLFDHQKKTREKTDDDAYITETWRDGTITKTKLKEYGTKNNPR